MTRTILAGDIGGTKTLLALFALDEAGREPKWSVTREARFVSSAYANLEDVIAAFRADGDEVIDAAAFGVSGPVLDGRVATTNLGWTSSDVSTVAAAVGTGAVRIMNDLESTAFGATFLRPDEIRTLHAGVERPGHIGVIAAGTGLGQAYLYWDGERYRPAGTEGGHTILGARNERELALLRYLLSRFGGHVSYERVVSGPGLHNLYRFITEVEGATADPEIARALTNGHDAGRVIGTAGVDGRCPVCRDAVDWFLALYGAQAANLAVTVMALGGVYVGGGIILEMLDRLPHSGFLDAFFAKGRYEAMMREIPVRVILDPRTSLIGAREAARELLA